LCSNVIVDTSTECVVRYTSDKFEVSAALKDIIWPILSSWNTITSRIRATIWGAMIPRSSYISDAHSFTCQYKHSCVLPLFIRIYYYFLARWSCSKDCLHGCRGPCLSSGSSHSPGSCRSLCLGSGSGHGLGSRRSLRPGSSSSLGLGLGGCCSFCLSGARGHGYVGWIEGGSCSPAICFLNLSVPNGHPNKHHEGRCYRPSDPPVSSALPGFAPAQQVINGVVHSPTCSFKTASRLCSNL
jgi:hypothetical protein